MVHIQQSVANEIIAEVEPDRRERCGFILGHQNSVDRIVTKLMVAENDTSGNRYNNFEIAACDYLHAEQMAERENLSLLGIYHSHHNHSACPSEYDQEMALPCFSYIIVSIKDKKFETMRSWQLNHNLELQEEEIEFI